MIIGYNVDITQWAQVSQGFPLLVRLFDKNGQHLTHFSTTEKFTVYDEAFNGYETIRQRFLSNGIKSEADKYKAMLLKPIGNRLRYGVNVRDLRDVNIVEIGFTDVGF